MRTGSLLDALRTPWAHPPGATSRPRPSAVLLPLTVALLGGLAGMVIALGSIPLTLLVISLILGPALLLLPSTSLVVLFMLMSTVIAGCMQFFLRVNQAHWLPAMLLMAMFIRLPVDAMRASLQKRKDSPGRLSGIGLLAGLFCVLVLISAAVNASPPLQVIVGFKQYVFPLALISTIVFAGASISFWLKVWKGVPWLMLVQLPVCLYQYLFVEKGSAAAFGALGIAWDRVVGTFGGNPEGGGASGALALFLCFGISATLALRKGQFISARLALTSCLAALSSIFLAEVKVVVVFLPMAVFIHFRRRILRSAGSLLLWGVSSVAFVLALLVAYQVLHYNAKNDWSVDLTQTFKYSTKAEEDLTLYNRETGEMSRVGALVAWAQENPGRGRTAESLIGYGPAASKNYSSLFGQGAVARRYAFQLQISTVSAMLWDLGLLGTGTFVALVALAFFKALALTRMHAADPLRGGLMESAAIALALTGVGLIYDGSSLFVASVQMLTSWALGMVLVVQAKDKGSDKVIAPAGAPVAKVGRGGR